VSFGKLDAQLGSAEEPLAGARRRWQMVLGALAAAAAVVAFVALLTGRRELATRPRRRRLSCWKTVPCGT